MEILDFSEHQGELTITELNRVNWDEYKYVIIRAGGGGYSGRPFTDKYFIYNYNLIRRLFPHIKIIIYWYFSNRCSYESQRDYILKLVDGLEIWGVAMDIERNQIWVNKSAAYTEILETRGDLVKVWDNAEFSPQDYNNFISLSRDVHAALQVAQIVYSNCSILRDLAKHNLAFIMSVIVWAAYPVDDYPDYEAGFSVNKKDYAYLGYVPTIWQRLWRYPARPLGFKSAYIDLNKVMIPESEFNALFTRSTKESASVKLSNNIGRIIGLKPRILIDGERELRYAREAEGIEAPAPEPPDKNSYFMLPIPYRSQISDAGAKDYGGDCGMTCVRMILDAYNKAPDVTINELHRAMGRGAGWAYFSDLQAALARYGIPSRNKWQNWDSGAGFLMDIDRLEFTLLGGYPVIALIDYEFIEHLNPYDNHFIGQHFIVVVGFDDQYIYINDPLWVDDKGYRWGVPRDLFAKAWKFTESPNATLNISIPLEGNK